MQLESLCSEMKFAFKCSIIGGNPKLAEINPELVWTNIKCLNFAYDL